MNLLTPRAGPFYRDTSLIRNCPPPQDHHRALGIILLKGPRGALFLMSEVPVLSSVPSESPPTYKRLVPPSETSRRCTHHFFCFNLFVDLR